MSQINAPFPFTALKSDGDILAAGGGDGTVRLFNLPSTKVSKAIRGLGDEVSSIAFQHSKDHRELWIACGRNVFSFNINSEKLVLTKEDSSLDIQPCKDEDDVLNEIDVNKTHLAFSCDSGKVGALDLSSKQITWMRSPHEQICSTSAFIPDRPRELVTCGYDSRIYHHDHLLGTLLSSWDLKTATATSTDAPPRFSMAPPFIQCASIYNNGAFAAGTADGRLIISLGGVKAANKRQKKWEGLKDDTISISSVADGPIVGIQWKTPDELLCVTLSGTIVAYNVTQRSATKNNLTSNVFKVNAFAIHKDLVVLGGLDAQGKGVLTISSMGDLESSEHASSPSAEPQPQPS